MAGLSSAGIRGEASNSFKNLLENTDGLITTNDRNGFFAGGQVSIPVDETLAIEPGILYSQKGQVMKGNFNFKESDLLQANATARLTLHYIDLPVMIKANFDELYFFAGPQLSYLLNADVRMSAGLLGLNFVNKNFDASSQFNNVDVALSGGMGYQLDNGLFLTASYNHGLSKLDKGNNIKAYNRALRVGIGMNF